MHAFIILPTGAISLSISGHSYMVDPTHPNHSKLKELLASARPSEKKILNLVDLPKSIKKFSHGKVTVKNGEVFYKNKVMHNVVAKRILELIRSGNAFKPVVRFLDNLMKNPSQESIDGLYKFLENKFLPLTDDGCFLGYKAIRSDWTDKHTGTFNNRVGRVVKMKREEVDANRANECSFGLHVGALEYVRGFGNGADDRIVVVKVDPKDCVAVPADYNFQKLRTSQYKVVAEFKDALEKPVYSQDYAG